MTSSIKHIYKSRPYLSHTIWGGQKLAKLKQLSLNSDLPLGETWEISKHPSGLCQLEGLDVKELNLSYLIKFIDTGDNLSIQVHPDDEYARKHENSSGKTECWIIMEAEPGAQIYLGFKDGVNKDEFLSSVHRGEDISHYLRSYMPKRGDFFFVPAGSVHAIGKGITLMEAQQSSGVTYRVWDWNRVDKNGNGRDLHIDKAIDVLNFDPSFNSDENFKVLEDCLNLENDKIVEHPQFSVSAKTIKANESVSINVGSDFSLVCLKGEVLVSHSNEESELLKAYETVYIKNSNCIDISTKAGAEIIWVS